IHYNNKTSAVNLYPGTKKLITASELNTVEALMEYNFANAIQNIAEDHKPLVGYTVSNGEPVGANVYDLIENVLRKDYSLFTFNINAEPVIPDTFKLLVIVKPNIPFSESEKIKLDQYVMRGGKILWCIDRLQAEMDSLRDLNRVVAYDRNLNLEDLLFKYGVRINPDLILDLQCDFLPFDVNGNGQYEFLHWNYFPLFQSKSNHSINKNIGLIAGRFVNTIDTVKAPDIVKTVLLSSSANSKTISAPALISGDENRNAPEDVGFKQHDLPVAVLLEGQFNSLYANRMSKALVDSLEILGTPVQTKALKPNKMIVISDGDVPLNSVVKEQPLPMGVNPYTTETQYQYTFANKDFMQSCISYLINTSGLNEAKSKDYIVRLLNTRKVDEERTYWQLINILFPVALVCISGWIYQYRRRKRFAS
ncbi:MAG: Gldg family protein, partial [Ginsengibacter sp.]